MHWHYQMGPKISLMETSLVSLWVASATSKSECVVALYGGVVSVDGYALAYLQKLYMS